ncbi:glycosyltransferase [Mesorhizobium sp.]|uniref:glycosyltransferase n=1 Tax=Mesorhizobium sp. TaxID=1871066 RepID=UPI000FE3A9B5|nr:glycosyltransferase [Mesorhizobium sp.]RWH68211.1 MAG: glycosyltransferase [Mesorhizobium sp.]RWL21606.1 MAG: glycosyltransferase [Mesorhizobium sp.]RWL26991.1 MAG: glycosyltransferase [Mesorhizobium sp.]RWL35476.1 MAG: glycosyltransferase [Mesorhizobium sp.]RWL51329.1 MAG: glycosyltransferase [Mesorhizobium sp.]
MNYYVLPGIGVYGGIKVGFQFARLLGEMGLPVAVATPRGMAPRWFGSDQPVVSREEIIAKVNGNDTLIFSLPHDYPVLKATGARLVFHCQGTDPLIDPVLRDKDVILLTCWSQAARYVNAVTGRESIEVGISISDVFFYDGTPKEERQAAYMPRRGEAIAEATMERVAHLRYLPIRESDEASCAAILKRCGYFLATAEAEWFGLPALEAMAAGCVVVSVPVLGGMEYLMDGDTARIAAPVELPTVLAGLSADDARGMRAMLRDKGVAMAGRYRIAAQRAKLRDAMQAGLRNVFSWN